jgi:hypothetical protein
MEMLWIWEAVVAGATERSPSEEEEWLDEGAMGAEGGCGIENLGWRGG